MQSIVYKIRCYTLHCNAAKKPDEQAAAASLRRGLDLRFEKRRSVWPRRSRADAHARQHVRRKAWSVPRLRGRGEQG
jgi:hypothetical protein